jgi:hypothetical protein
LVGKFQGGRRIGKKVLDRRKRRAYVELSETYDQIIPFLKENPQMTKLKKHYRFLLVVGILWGVAALVAVVRFNAIQGETLTEEYKQKVNQALAEISFPTSLNQNAIDNATENLSSFMYYRSGIQLSQSNKDLLRTTELNFWSNNKRVDPATLTSILADLVYEQVPQLSNTQITEITEGFRGFNAPGLPASFQENRNFVTLRASGRGQMSTSGFSTELTALRDGGIGTKTAQTMVYVAVDAEVNRKTKMILDASPNFFGGVEMRMTPLQAVLVAYSIVTDDQLLYNQSELQQRMQNMQTGIQQAIGQSYPSPSGYRAYGGNGYIFSSPAQTILTDARITRLLTSIQERGN